MPSTAVRPTALHAAPALVSSHHVHDVIEDRALERENAALRRELAALARDNKSLQCRTRTMTAALLEIAPREADVTPEPIIVGVYGAEATITQLVTAAQTTECFGDVPAIRFARNANNRIVGVELVKLASDEDSDDAADEFDATFRTLATLALVGGAQRA